MFFFNTFQVLLIAENHFIFLQSEIRWLDLQNQSALADGYIYIHKLQSYNSLFLNSIVNWKSVLLSYVDPSSLFVYMLFNFAMGKHYLAVEDTVHSAEKLLNCSCFLWIHTPSIIERDHNPSAEGPPIKTEGSLGSKSSSATVRHQTAFAKCISLFRPSIQLS